MSFIDAVARSSRRAFFSTPCTYTSQKNALNAPIGLTISRTTRDGNPRDSACSTMKRQT
jgi:hypothetical protein